MYVWWCIVNDIIYNICIMYFVNNTHTYYRSPSGTLSAMISISLIHKVACFLPEGLLQWNPILWVCIAGLMNSHIQACFWGCLSGKGTPVSQFLFHIILDFSLLQGTLAEFLVAAWHLKGFLCELPTSSHELRRRYPFVLLNEYDGLNRSGASGSDNGGIIWKSVAISMSVFKGTKDFCPWRVEDKPWRFATAVRQDVAVADLKFMCCTFLFTIWIYLIYLILACLSHQHSQKRDILNLY